MLVPMFLTQIFSFLLFLNRTHSCNATKYHRYFSRFSFKILQNVKIHNFLKITEVMLQLSNVMGIYCTNRWSKIISMLVLRCLNSFLPFDHLCILHMSNVIKCQWHFSRLSFKIPQDVKLHNFFWKSLKITKQSPNIMLQVSDVMWFGWVLHDR